MKLQVAANHSVPSDRPLHGCRRTPAWLSLPVVAHSMWRPGSEILL